MGSSSAVTPEALLESLMNDGTIDAIRSKIINQLKANEELKNSTISMVEQSKVLNTPGAEKQTKRELFDALRRELESKVLEKASKSVWELILDNDGLGKEISETVERVYCRLGGRELPVLPPVNGNVSSEKDKENSNSSSRKRSFSAMNMQGADEVVNKPRSTPAVPEDSGKPKVGKPCNNSRRAQWLTMAVMKEAEAEAPYGGGGTGIRGWVWQWLAVVVQTEPNKNKNFCWFLYGISQIFLSITSKALQWCDMMVVFRQLQTVEFLVAGHGKTENNKIYFACCS